MEAGNTKYVWIPYTKDRTNGILGSIVQVRLEERNPVGVWRTRIMVSGKPTAATAKDARLYITEDEFFDSATEVAERRAELYEQYLNEQKRLLLHKGA